MTNNLMRAGSGQNLRDAGHLDGGEAGRTGPMTTGQRQRGPRQNTNPTPPHTPFTASTDAHIPSPSWARAIFPEKLFPDGGSAGRPGGRDDFSRSGASDNEVHTMTRPVDSFGRQEALAKRDERFLKTMIIGEPPSLIDEPSRSIFWLSGPSCPQ